MNDLLSLQNETGNPPQIFARADEADMRALEEFLKKEKTLGIFCELPGNPFAKNVTLERLQLLSKKYTTPLILHDTLGTCAEPYSFEAADVATFSLSRLFSETEDATAGALVMNPKSRFAAMFARIFRDNFEDLLSGATTSYFAQSPEEVDSRLRRIRENTWDLAEFLRQDPRVAKVFVAETRGAAPESRLPLGSIFFLLNQPERRTPDFYDALKLAKGFAFTSRRTVLTPAALIFDGPKAKFITELGLSPLMLRLLTGTDDVKEVCRELDAALTAVFSES